MSQAIIEVRSRSTPNPWVAFAVIAVAIYLTILDLYIVNVAIHAIAADFSGADISSLSWVLTAYAVAFSAILVPAGKLGDLYGRRRPACSCSSPGRRSVRQRLRCPFSSSGESSRRSGPAR